MDEMSLTRDQWEMIQRQMRNMNWYTRRMMYKASGRLLKYDTYEKYLSAYKTMVARTKDEKRNMGE
jgi:hypothetical protein